jgi:hypothetical protein
MQISRNIEKIEKLYFPQFSSNYLLDDKIVTCTTISQDNLCSQRSYIQQSD